MRLSHLHCRPAGANRRHSDPRFVDRISMRAPVSTPLRLTQFSHGGGCGCKIAPALLQQILGKAGPSVLPPALLVGVETSDAAAV